MEPIPPGDFRGSLSSDLQRTIAVPIIDAPQLVCTVSQSSTRFRLQAISALGAELTRRTNLARKAERITLEFVSANQEATTFIGRSRALDSLPGTDFGRGAKDLRLLFDALERAAAVSP
jgi:hypothetical protein